MRLCLTSSSTARLPIPFVSGCFTTTSQTQLLGWKPATGRWYVLPFATLHTHPHVPRLALVLKQTGQKKRWPSLALANLAHQFRAQAAAARSAAPRKLPPQQAPCLTSSCKASLSQNGNANELFVVKRAVIACALQVTGRHQSPQKSGLVWELVRLNVPAHSSFHAHHTAGCGALLGWVSGTTFPGSTTVGASKSSALRKSGCALQKHWPRTKVPAKVCCTRVWCTRPLYHDRKILHM